MTAPDAGQGEREALAVTLREAFDRKAEDEFLRERDTWLYAADVLLAAGWRSPGGLNRFPRVQGRCPACGASSLFLGAGGYVTCSVLDCREPDAATTLLERSPRPATEAVDLESLPIRERDERVAEVLRFMEARGYTITHPGAENTRRYHERRRARLALARTAPTEDER